MNIFKRVWEYLNPYNIEFHDKLFEGEYEAILHREKEAKMNCRDMVAQRVFEHELDHINSMLGPPENKEGYYPSEDVYLVHAERLKVVKTYLTNRIMDLDKISKEEYHN